MAVAITDQIAKPSEDSHVMGRFTLNQFVRCEASVAAPIAFANLDDIVEVNIGQTAYDYEVDVYSQGAGDNKRQIRRGPRWDGQIIVQGGKLPDVVALLLGQTWTSAGNTGLLLRNEGDVPQIILQSHARSFDNSTHLYTRVIQDIILDDIEHASPIDYADRVIPFHTYHEPFLIPTGTELVYDRWAATPTTLEYTCSNSTPLDIVTASGKDDWTLDNAVYVKVKDDSRGDDVGIRVKAGVTRVAGALTFVTAATPSASDEVSHLYVKATS